MGDDQGRRQTLASSADPTAQAPPRSAPLPSRLSSTLLTRCSLLRFRSHTPARNGREHSPAQTPGVGRSHLSNTTAARAALPRLHSLLSLSPPVSDDTPPPPQSPLTHEERPHTRGASAHGSERAPTGRSERPWVHQARSASPSVRGAHSALYHAGYVVIPRATASPGSDSAKSR